MSFIKFHRKLAKPVGIGGVLLAIVFLAIHSKKITIGFRNAVADSNDFSTASPMSEAERRSEANIVLTVDSILSVIQGYYVDQSRVDSLNLIKIGESVLKRFPGITYEATKSGAKISLNGVTDQIPRPDKSAYSDLLSWIVNIEKFFGKSQPNLKPFSFSRSLLLTLDAHSAYLTPEDYLDLKQGTEGVFGGLGVMVGMRDSVLTVIKPIPYSPAAKSGIKRRDKILSIDGHKTFGATLDHLIDVMRGAPGTEVKLHLLRDGALTSEAIALRREVIQVESVTSEVLELPNGNILHLTIDSFSSRTATQVAEAMQHFKRHNPGRKAMVLDLRSNPGGLLDQAVAVVDQFVDSGVIVATKGRREETELVTSGEHDIYIPLVVLINGESASASEIVAGALQDHNRALVVGQKSFGKGSVQTVFELPGDSAVKITIARYYTPNGRSIQSFGVVPDVAINPVEKTKFNSNILPVSRYRSEAFLDQHLQNDDKSKSLWSRSAFEGFYLSNEKDEFSTSTVDQELEFSKALFSKAFEHEFQDQVKFRASHFSSALAGDINAWLVKSSNEVYSWLDDKFQVNWKDGSLDSSHLEFTAVQVGEAFPGRDLDIRFTTSNRGREASGRVSVFVRGELGVEAEKLLGKIEPNTRLTDRVPVSLPSNFTEKAAFFDVGLAVNGDPVESTIVRIPVRIEERGYSFARVNVDLEKDKVGSMVEDSRFLPKSMLAVNLINDSIVKMSNVDVYIGNLAGQQADLSDFKRRIPEIPARSQIKLLFPLQVAAKTQAKDLEFGVKIDSPDLRRPYQDIFRVPLESWKKNKPGASNALSH